MPPNWSAPAMTVREDGPRTERSASSSATPLPASIPPGDGATLQRNRGATVFTPSPLRRNSVVGKVVLDRLRRRRRRRYGGQHPSGR